jgi:3-hydroxyisobutyrate dehydrogenase-like beta-hydroxyacid dehydrogenase
MNVGFIGLGHMGQPMARRLLKSGQRLVVYNRTHSKAEPLAAQGAEIANNVAEACRADVVITQMIARNTRRPGTQKWQADVRGALIFSTLP